MPKRHARRVVAVAAVLACVGADGPAGRTAKQITADYEQVVGQIRQKRYPDGVKYGPVYRQQMGREYGPLYEQERALLIELAAAVPKAASAYRCWASMDDARLAFWGVGGAAGRLDAAEADADRQASTDGKLAKLLVRWWSAGDDADAQRAVADDVEPLVAAMPTSGAVADAVHLMLVTKSSATPAAVAVGQRLTTDLTAKLGATPVAKAYAPVPNKIDEPLLVDGMQLAGKPFHSKDWAGKVVLLDFWATWCPPCREEIPHVAKLYKQYHDQGLEVVGISSDNDKRVMAAFLKDHAEMPWPELFGSTSGWHPLTKKYGINSIPRMYLLDRNGVLRTVEARELMDTMIPALLAEPYTPPAAKPAANRPGGGVAAKPTPTGGVPTDEVNGLAHRAASVGGMN